MISNLKYDTYAGYDGSFSKNVSLIVYIRKYKIYSLTLYIYNLSLKVGLFLHKIKLAIIKPLLKIGVTTTSVNNYKYIFL